MAMRRSTQMLLIGSAIFVVGAGVVFISLSGGGDGGSASATTATTSTTVQPGTVVVPSPSPAATPDTSFTIPANKEAVAVQVPFVAGLAGYARAGDTVNLYAAVEKGQPNSDPPPVARLILPNVQVLAVTGPAVGAGAGNTTYLLALDAAQAEQAIFFSRFESLWLTLVPKGQPAASTPGRSYKNAF